MTLSEVVSDFMADCKSHNRRTSTLLNYQSVLDKYVLPKFGSAEVGAIGRHELKACFRELTKSGKSAQLVNRIIRVLKAVLLYAVTELEVLERKVPLRFKPTSLRKDRRAGASTAAHSRRRADSQ